MKRNTLKKRILVAPLNWGIGHATRCVPIINALLQKGYEPVIASDGDALRLLRKEFPELTFLSLQSYDIKYAEKRCFFKWVLFKQSKKIYKAIKAEKKQVDRIVNEFAISGIISDNRLGVWSDKIPSVYLTHQLNVLSGVTSKTTSKIHQRFIKQFDRVWVPDFEKAPNLSGKLGHLFPQKSTLKITYIGPLSRLIKKSSEKKYDIMVLLSGPESQRHLLEEKLFKQLKTYNGKILFVKGKINTKQTVSKLKPFTVYNFMTSKDLEEAINCSELIISRSGYTTIMDLAALEKRAFFIPTPGQSEQEYLAESLHLKGIAPYCKQENFNLEKLKEVTQYKGFERIESATNFSELFTFF